MTYKFTKSGEKVLEIAEKLAKTLGHIYVGTEHLLFGLIDEKNGVAGKVLESQNLTSEKLLEKIKDMIGVNVSQDAVLGFTPKLKKILENSYMEAKKLDSNYISTEHMLVGMLEENDSIAKRLLIELNVNLDKIYEDIAKILNEFENDFVQNSSYNKNNYNTEKDIEKGFLKNYSINLNKKVLEGKIDPVIGREEETNRVIEVLLRRTKNNPCLIGEPGVGKTAIVEGLAQRIVSGNVPSILKDKVIYVLDITSILAGAKYRGDFEERIKKCIKEAKENKNIILFIDEIHTIVGAGSADGAIDAANILKPVLARGEVQLVGATTIKEYRKFIEKDKALERRFEEIIVDEPTEDETLSILKGIRDKYEAHHYLKISDEALCAAISLSERYIQDRFLPDKAIDLIDEACSKINLENLNKPEFLREIESDLEKVKLEKREAINIEEYIKAAKIKEGENKLLEVLDEEENKWNDKKIKEVVEVKKEDIEKIVARKLKIPVYKLNQNEKKKVIELEEKLNKEIIGQEEAIKVISTSIKRNWIRIEDKVRPIGSFLFLGKTGVGKTELAKSLNNNLFDVKDSLIRLDMSEYMEKNDVSKLIGSAPGYVGYEEGGLLIEKVRKRPYSIILFDEIEKAHPDIMNILLQILEEGELTDNQGRKAYFKNTIIILTSNIGAEKLAFKKKLGFGLGDVKSLENEDIKNELLMDLKREIKPEIINRIDDIVVFNILTDEDILKILMLNINRLKCNFENEKYFIEFDENVYDYLFSKLKEINKNETENNARDIRKIILKYVENLLAENILEEKVIKNKKYKIYVENNKLNISEEKIKIQC